MSCLRTTISVFCGLFFWGAIPALVQGLHNPSGASRLATSASESVSATYGYRHNSPLVASLVFEQDSSARLNTPNQSAHIDPPTSVSHGPQGLAHVLSQQVQVPTCSTTNHRDNCSSFKFLAAH